MDNNQYKIELGVKLNTNDLKTEVDKIDDKYQVKLGVDLKVNDIRDRITQYNKNTNNAKLLLKVKLDTDDLKRQISKLNLGSASGKGVATPINIQSLKTSLKEVKDIIADIRNTIGTLDNGGDIKSLVSSINQMATALGKAESESDSLVKSLSALSKKDFSINIGLDMGKKNNNMIAYGRAARKQVIPELESQIKYLENLFGGQQATMNKLTSQGGKVGFDVFTDFADFNSDSAIKKMEAMEKYINSLKKLATIDNVDLSGFNEIHKDATGLINDITGLDNAVDKAGDVPEKIKNLLGGSVDGEKLSAQLDDIVTDLNEIKTALQSLSSGVSIEGLTQSFDKLSDTIEKLVQNATQVKNVLGDGVSNAGISNQAKAAQETANAYQEAAKEAKKLDNISIDISDGDIDALRNALKNLKVDDTSIENMIYKLNEMNIVAERVSGTLKNDNLVKLDIKGIQSMEDGLKRVATITKALGKDGWTTSEKFSQSFDKATESVKRLKKEAETANKIKIDIGLGTFENQVSQIKDNFNKLSDVDGSLDSLRASIKQVEDAYEAMKNATDDESLIQAQKQYAAAIEKANNELKIQAREQKAANDAAKLADNRASLKYDMLNWLKKNSKAAKEYKSQIDKLIASLDELDQAGINGVRRQFNNIDKDAEFKGLKGLSLFDSIKSKIKEYSVYFSAAEMFMYAEQGLRSMFEQVKLIDSAMTELKKVTNETDEAYNQFLTNAATRSREIGTTIDGLVSSTADFARLGYGFEDAQGLAEVANIYAVVGDEIEGVEGATESLISTMAAFKNEMNGMSNTDFAMSIIDKFNEIGNNFAISSGGIGEALERSASSLMAANNTIDESIALITAANTVVQNPEQVGNAFKTISMRIRGAKTELEEAGLETEGMVESTAKLRSEILALSGVDIMLNENEFKSTYQIMDELAAKWEDLSDIQQATVTELIAGKRQGNIVSSLMTNFDTAREALDTSLNSAGSAMKEHEKWQQSLEAQINKLKASWQGLSQAFLKSDFLKAALDAIIDLVDGLTKLIDKVGAFPVLLGIFAGLKGVPALFGKIFTTAKDAGIGIKSFADVLNLLKQSFPRVTELIGRFIASLKKSEDGSRGFTKSLKGIFDALKQHWIIAVVVAAITVLTAVFGYQAKQAEKLSKKVEELTDKYKEQHEELKKIKNDYDTSNESSMISKYEKLSKGVDHYGKNISLTAEEYSEYQDIVNQIAEQFPSLVSGYDEQGNALLSCKGNVEQLTEAYEKLIHAQNQAILTNTGDIEKDFENTLTKASGEHWWSNGHGFWAGLLNNYMGGTAIASAGGAPDIGTGLLAKFGKRFLDYELKTDTAQAIQDLINAKNDSEKNEILTKLKQDRYAEEELRDLLPDIGYDVGFFESPYKVLEEALEKDSAKLQEVVNNYYASFSEAVEKEKTIAQAKLSEAFDISSAVSGLDYGNITEELQTLAHRTVANLDLDFFEELNEQGKTVEQWTTELLNQLNAIGKINGSDIEKAFELQTQFNGGDIDYGDYIGKLREVETIIDGLDLKDEAKTQLKISLGLDENGVVDQYDALINRLTSKEIGLNEKSVRKFLDGLSAEELDVLVDIVPKLEAGTTIDKIQAMIDEQLATEFKFDIAVQTEGVEALNTALAESRSAAGLTSESIKALKARYEDLDGFNAAALFEKTANGIHLNSEELSRLEEQYVATNKLEIDKNLNTLITKYNDLTDEIKGCTDAQKKEELQLKANAYKNKIDELSTLASQYDGLTSAFAKWQTALDGAEEGDNYDSLYENLEGIKELYDKGLVGTDKFKTAAQLMTNKDLANADIDEIVSAYKKGYPKMQRYFTEGQKGCKNFLNDVRNLNSEWAHMNKDGSWEINFNAEEVAKELGVSVDFVLQIAKKLKDYGFEVNLEDSSVDNLKTKIEKTEAKLKELGQSPVDINVDIDASSANLGKIESEIDKAKSKIKEINNSSVDPKVKTAQLEDARAKLETLIDKKQEASQPAFMNLNTSQVNASLVDALEKIQDYQNAINEVNKLTELKEAGIAIDDSQLKTAKEKVDECAKAIQGLDGDVKVAIGLEEDGSIDSIKKAFEEGKVKIDANTDPALTKIEQLAENVERIEDKDVTINVTVNGLDQVKELNRQIDLATDIDGDIDKLSKYVENAKELNKLGNNVVSKVTADVYGNVTKTPEYELNNLKVFSDSAKEIKDIGSPTSYVTANIDGNVKDIPEFAINNLKVFTDSAKDIGDIGYVEANVVARINTGEKGDVVDTFEHKLNNLGVFAEGAKALSDIGDISSTVTAKVNSGEDGDAIDEFEYKLNNLKVFADGAKELKDIGGNVGVEVTAKVNTGESGDVVDTFEYKLDNLSEFATHAKALQDVKDVDVEVNAKVNTGEDDDVTEVFEYKLNNLGEFATHTKELQGLKDVDVAVTAKINTGEQGDVVDEFEYKLNNLGTFAEGAKSLDGVGDVSSTVTAKVNTGEDGDAIDEFEYKLNNLEVFAKGAKELKGVGGDVSTIVTAEVNTGDGSAIDEFEYKIDNLGVFATHAKELQELDKEIDVSVNANINTGEDNDVVEVFEYKLNNLGEFATHAKELQELDDVDISVTAKVNTGEDGDVVDTFEYKLNNLGEFAKNAKELQDIEKDINVAVTAKINTGEKGDVVDTFEHKLNNLEVFAKGAKELDGVGDVSSTVTAKVNTEGNGDAIYKFEGQLNNLKLFAEGAKAVAGIGGNPSSTVTAKINTKLGESDATDLTMFEGRINNLKVFAEGAKAVQDIGGDPSSTVTAKINTKLGDSDATDLTMFEGRINNLKVFAEAAKALDGVGDVSTTVTAKVATGSGIDAINRTDAEINRIKTFADAAKALKGVGDVSTTVTAKMSGNAVSGEGVSDRLASLSKFKSITSGMSDKTVTVSVTAKVDSENVNAAIDLLKKVADSGVFKDYKATVQVGAKIATIDDTTVKNYNAPKKEGKVAYSVDPESSVYGWTAPDKDGVVNYSASVEALTDSQKYKTGTITYKAKISGFPVVNGTANANGTAFANGTSGKAYKQGDWGVKKTTTALTGELGQELVVYGNRFWTVGDHGAEFATIPKGAIVFNHKQTKELFANGKVTSDGGRGRMFANGTAFAQGTAFVSGGGKFGDENASNDFEEIFDWIEIAFSRLERSIDNLDKAVNNVYDSWENRSKNLDAEITYAKYLENQANSAKSEYGSEMNKIAADIIKITGDKLTAGQYLGYIRNGTINLEDFKGADDEELYNALKEYQTLYEQYLDATDKADEAVRTQAELQAQHFDDIISRYDGILEGFEHTESMIDEYIAQAEARGHIVSGEYYQALIDNNNQNVIPTLTSQRSELLGARADYVAAMQEQGMNLEDIYNSEKHREMCNDIDGVTQEIEKARTQTIEWKNDIRDLEWSNLDLAREKISNLNSEADFFVELMSNKDLFDDDGKMTNEGLATMGVYAQKHNTHMYLANDYKAEIEEIDKQIEALDRLGDYDQNLINRRQELVEAQRESILAAEDEKQAIRDLISDGIEKELDALQERIDLHNEELDSMKDLYDYQKNVQKQSEEIAALEKQRAAYLNDTSESGKAKLQEITVSLKEAKESLKETEFDRYISQQEELLSTLYDEYELTLNERLDNLDGLITEAFAIVNEKADTINSTIDGVAGNVGIEMSEELSNIWSGENGIEGVVREYGDGFNTSLTSVITTLGTIKGYVGTLASKSDEEAKENIEQPKTDTSYNADPTGGSGGSGGGSKGNGGSSGGNKLTGGDGKVKIGDKVKFLKGKYYYDSQGVNPAGSKYQGKYVYITNVNNKPWATHQIHISAGKKLGDKDLGWLKKNQISGYATGKKNFLNNEIAWTQENGQEFIVRPSDGAILTPIAKGDSVLTSAASSNIWDMANSPAEFIKDNLKLGATNVPNNSTVQSSYTQILDKVVFNLPNVHNYEEFISAMQKDKNFERLIKSMTIDQIVGKSSLAKGKSIR